MPVRVIRNPFTKWLLSQCTDLKTVVIVLGVVWTGINVHFSRATVIDHLATEQVDLRKDVDKNTDDIRKVNHRISTETVSQKDFDLYTRQLDATLANLSTGQQQIYNLLVLQGRGVTGVVTMPASVAPAQGVSRHR